MRGSSRGCSANGPRAHRPSRASASNTDRITTTTTHIRASMHMKRYTRGARWLQAIAMVSMAVLPAVAQSQAFAVEESTIEDVHRAIQSGEATCKSIVQSYLERVRAYNGMCTRLVTKDGKPILAAKGAIRAGVP